MLPYIHFLYIQLGPIKIYTWGFFVALGFLAGLFLLKKKYPEEKETYLDLGIYVLLGAIAGARLFFVLFYSEEQLSLRNFFKIWDGGMSSMGGIFGGAIAAYLYARYEEIDFYELAQKLAFVLPLGLAIGRIGCFLTNDHPGIRIMANPLSVNYPDGSRFDLGLLEALFSAFVFGYFLILKKSYPQKKHLFLEKFLIIYGTGRFLLDFLRIDEMKYAGLIPSQYATIIIVAVGVYLYIKKPKFNN